MGCAACHKIGDSGGIIGPDLSAVGSGVPGERIVTEVLWPTRQVKDGFSLTLLTLKDGSVLQGYLIRLRGEPVADEGFTSSINGKPASQFTDHATIGRFESGGIALQIHDKGMIVEFKEIRLKKLR